ncbi:unnamed protein product [Adineta steineri]|uniref:Vacuolar protein sorting-associated protein 16 homolog n=2 Tax=Adineta steineri TaxID=433720 RepID=A0A814S4Y0_9BILA|nr:unnamed protein product [Adineta steineri]CAF1174628.1 unnamed protein product [Adineta steineri]CAF3518830.1 unnamed protein product [Adineta steineri]CAF4094690.1 unnamed protein product [Adineta steineri]
MNELDMNEQRTHATSTWRVFDDITYKKIEGNTVTDFLAIIRDARSATEDTIKPFVTMAPCGGPIAFVYKKSEAKSNDNKYTIIIDNLPNHRPQVKQFDRGVVVFVDWTINEDLLLVTEDGKYHIIDIFFYDSNNDKSRQLSESVSTITSACTFKSNQGTGLVALTKNQESFIAVKNVYSPIIQMITLGVDIRSPISAWCVIDHADITIAYAYDNNIATCSATSLRRDQQTIPGITDVIVKLVSSSNYKSIAMLKDNGDVLIGLKENIGQPQSFILKYTCNNNKVKITDIAWSGSDTVIGIRSASKTWFDLLVINGKHSLPMTEKSRQAITDDTMCYTSTVWLSTEIDGIRIISGRALDFFQRLPDEIYKVLDLMSKSPGAKLYEAYMYYKYENQMAERFLQELKSSGSSYGLEEAVKECIAAASNEHDPPTQKLLLKSALFGRSFLSVNLSNPTASIRPAVSVINDLCTNTIRNLQLVNNLQHISISILITYKQFELLGTRILIDRLLRRNLHEFATCVTKLLRMPAEEGENRILVQWAVQKLNDPANTNEELIADTIRVRLADVPGIPFIDIIRAAYTAKKFIVVERLLDVKVSLSDQIDMLLTLNKKQEALQKALSYGDTDLALYVLMRMKSSSGVNSTDFNLQLAKLKSLPLSLLLQCLEERDRNNLHDEMRKQNSGERERIGYSHIVQRFTTALTTSDQKSELTSASKLFREIKNDSSAQLVDEETRLITKQDELEKKLQTIQLKGFSLVDTLDLLIIHNERDADLLRKEFNISDKRYWWIKIQAYAKKNAWVQLLEFGKKPSSPIGYEPFVDVCIRSQKLEEARRFLDQTIYSSKLDHERIPYMFAKVQMVDEAINSAIKLRSIDALHFIESKCQLSEANSTKIQQAKDKLQDYGVNPLKNVFSFLKS